MFFDNSLVCPCAHFLLSKDVVTLTLRYEKKKKSYEDNLETVYKFVPVVMLTSEARLCDCSGQRHVDN